MIFLKANETMNKSSKEYWEIYFLKISILFSHGAFKLIQKILSDSELSFLSSKLLEFLTLTEAKIALMSPYSTEFY